MESRPTPVRDWGKDFDRGVVRVSSDSENASTETTEKVCGCGGCTEPASAVIQHPKYGRRTVCDDHSEPFRVIEYV